MYLLTAGPHSGQIVICSRKEQRWSDFFERGSRDTSAYKDKHLPTTANVQESLQISYMFL